MQARIARGPHVALDVAEGATVEQVRAAFLALTKQFHPARFGRLSPELLRNANEVFLGIKGAHEAMLKALGAPTRRGSAYQSGGLLPMTAGTTGPMPRAASPVIPTNTSASGVFPRPTTGTPVARPTGTQPPQAEGTQPITARTQTPTHRTGQPAIPRTLTPSTAPRTTMPIARPPTATTPAPHAPPAPQDFSTPTARFAGSPPVSQPSRTGGAPRPPAAAWDERAALQDALDLVGARDWVAAKAAVHALATRVPQSRPYRALLSYVRGREFQANGKHSEAQGEYERALQLDPSLAQAKLALANLKRK